MRFDLVPFRPRIRGRIVRRALALLACSGAFIAVTAPAEARVLKRLDFETGSLGQWTSKQALPGRIDVVPSPVRQGQFASRFTVKPGDHPVAGGERAELMFWSHERAGKTSWWRWSTYFPKGFHPNRGAWNVFTQWHQTGDSCVSPVRFLVDRYSSRPRLRLDIWSGRLSSCNPQYKHSWSLGRLHRNHWYNFVVKFKWSPRASRGFVKVSVNGRTRVHRHVATLYRGMGVYVKQGFYRGNSSRTTTIIHDGLQRFRP
ncbi:MAG TPA: polysaccharide lyase [Gaiellaceae bacterium]|nr:polysaccharide lyase [Gaiellaceae bacterium]